VRAGPTGWLVGLVPRRAGVVTTATTRRWGRGGPLVAVGCRVVVVVGPGVVVRVALPRAGLVVVARTRMGDPLQVVEVREGRQAWRGPQGPVVSLGSSCVG
jgi:hypothetical protein